MNKYAYRESKIVAIFAKSFECKTAYRIEIYINAETVGYFNLTIEVFSPKHISLWCEWN